MKNTSGMSLVELVIAMGVGAVMLTAVSYLASSTMSFFAQVDRTSNVSDMQEVLRLTLTSKSQCTSNFANIPLSANNLDGIPISRISNYDESGNMHSALIESSKDYRGISVSKILLKPIAEVGTDLLIANVEVTMKAAAGVKNGISEFSRVTPLFVRLQGGKIKECWSKKDHQGSSQIEANTVCEESSLGAKSVYDPVTKTCVLGKAKWSAGSLNAGSCPVGTHLPKDSSPYTACRGYVDPLYWDDPASQISIEMQDGSILQSSRAPLKQSIVNGSCVCSWADDIPPASLTNASCQILCVER